MKYKKPIWVCPHCKRPNWHNKTICYHCAKRRDYGRAPDQKDLGL